MRGFLKSGAHVTLLSITRSSWIELEVWYRLHLVMSRFFVDPDISVAKTIHTDFYNSQQVLEQCKERIFAATYQFVAHADMVREPGEVYPVTLLEGYVDEPLLLSKDETGSIHLLSNVCTHRGNILA